MGLSTEDYKKYCVQYFRAMYSAGWNAESKDDIEGCEEICKQIRENAECDAAVSYNSYVAYRNRGSNQYQATAVTESQNTAPSIDGHTPDKYTKHDGLMADERLLASQQHTIIMLLTEIATTNRAIAEALHVSPERLDESVQVTNV